jgi:uncharacterized protein with FMN-binding domain
MRRVVPAVMATIGALILLASFHTTPGTATRIAVGKATSNRPSASAPPPAQAASTTSSPQSTASGPRQITGPVVSNQYGDVQVRITVANGKLTDVEALRLPQDHERSVRISEYSAPQLRLEALDAQSANIDVISGATYTSDSYAQSLQAALDRARLGGA